jgi:hypothetical protein
MFGLISPAALLAILILFAFSSSVPPDIFTPPADLNVGFSMVFFSLTP